MTTGKLSEENILEFFKKYGLLVEQKDEQKKKTTALSDDFWPVGQYRNAGNSSASGSAGTIMPNAKESYGRLE